MPSTPLHQSPAAARHFGLELGVRACPLALLLVGLPGCAPDPSGIWFITTAFQDEEPVCTTELSENFTLAYPPAPVAEAVEWLSSESRDGNDTLSFFQIETTAEGEAVLLIGNATYPGEGSEDAWTFTWDDSDRSSTSDEHISGYFFAADAQTSSETKLTFTFGDDDDHASGKVTLETSAVSTWQESDTWTEDVSTALGSTFGQIPAGTYLVTEDAALGTEVPAANDYLLDDCDGDYCQMGTQTSCSSSQSYTAVLTDYEDESAYLYLQSAGQL